MFKIHLNEDGSLVLPAQVRDWMGVKLGGDLMVTVEGQKLVLHEWEDGAGILARYSKPEGGSSARGESASETRREQIGAYLEALDARTRSSR